MWAISSKRQRGVGPSRDRRTLPRRLALTAVVSSLPMLALPAGSARAGTPNPVITLKDQASGQQLIVTNNGVCGKVSVQQSPLSGTGFGDQGVTHELDYSVDKNCRVSILKPSPSGGNVAGSTTASSSSATAGSGPIVSPATSGGSNVIHGSQTLLDAVGITVARFQYSHDRTWDGYCCTYFAWDWWMAQTVSVSWNHNVGNPRSLGYNSGWTSGSAYGTGEADFHSDFLWCNFQAGQNFSEYDELQSNYNGSYYAYFWDSTLCSGLHHATRMAADNTHGNIW